MKSIQQVVTEFIRDIMNLDITEGIMENQIIEMKKPTKRESGFGTLPRLDGIGEREVIDFNMNEYSGGQRG